MEESKKKMLGYIFAGIIALGLVLVIVGMFTAIFSIASGGGEAEAVKLFDEGWAKMAEAAPALAIAGISTPSRAFVMIAFVVAIVGAVVLIVNAILKLVVKKEIKLLGMIGGIVTVIGGILIIVAAILLGSSMVEYTKEVMKAMMGGAAANVEVTSSIGMGAILGGIGGIIAGAAGVASSLKQFN